jgi:hypothetical protein
MSKFTVAVEVSKEQIETLLVWAFEGGSNYWYRIEGDAPLSRMKGYADEALKQGIVVSNFFAVETGHPIKQRTLNEKAIKRGLKLLPKKAHLALADVIQDNADATTGDVFLQLCLYGEVVYG